MKDKAWFNVVFMLICTVILTGILSGVYVYSRPLIQANTRLRGINAQIYALGIDIPVGMNSTDLLAFYEQVIEEKKINGLTVFQYQADDGSIWYAFPFEGAALWGDISGIIALDHDLKTVLGLDFISQNETPGLGGRIEEEWFKEQFRGIALYEDGDAIRYATAGSNGQVDAITGATNTSTAVLDTINETVSEIKARMGGGN